MGRLSISLDTDNCLLELEPGPGSPHTIGLRSSTLDPRRQARHPHAEAKSFKSSVCLPQVRFDFSRLPVFHSDFVGASETD